LKCCKVWFSLIVCANKGENRSGTESVKMKTKLPQSHFLWTFCRAASSFLLPVIVIGNYYYNLRIKGKSLG
jgi:hypothetical protein